MHAIEHALCAHCLFVYKGKVVEGHELRCREFSNNRDDFCGTTV